MKTVFVGAVEGSRRALEALCANGHVPDLIVTLPLSHASRHADFVDLGELAEAHGCAVHRTLRSDADETLDAIRAVEPDLIMVIGWSQLCGEDFRAIPKIGCLGFHPSVLPRLRGRAVVAWTVLLGETESGGTLFWLSEGADTGDIAAQARFAIDPDTITVRALYDRQVDALCDMLPPLLDGIERGDIPRIPQDHSRASVCAKRTPEDGRIDWSWPAERIERLVRAVGDPYAGAFTLTAEEEKLIIAEARIHPRRDYFVGIEGQVQARDEKGFTVMCGDGACLDVLTWHGPENAPKLHSILGDKGQIT